MTLAKMKNAQAMRDVVTQIATATINQIRPAERIGKVYSIDLGRSVAKIYFAGETIDSLIEARFAKDKIPTQQMITTFETNGYDAPANIVRIAGSPGSYYILDYVSGIPAIDPSARALVVTNTAIINGNVGVIGGQVGVVQGQIVQLNTDLDALDTTLTVLNTTTLPGLVADLGDANAEIDALKFTTIPALNTRLTTAEGSVTTLNNTTIPALNTSLANANTAIALRTQTIFQTAQPTGLLSTDRVIWYDTDDGYKASYWNGTTWAPYQLSGSAFLPGGIVTSHMAANTINGSVITAGTLNADKIVAGSITSNEMTANTINGDRITANTLNASKIIAGTITTGTMTANTIDGSVITANTLNATKIVAGSITTTQMTANTINGDRVTANTINGDKIIANTINGDRVIANTIQGDRIVVNTLNGDRIIAGTITATALNVVPGGGNLMANSGFESSPDRMAGWAKYDNAGVATLTTVIDGRRDLNAARLTWTTTSGSIVGLYRTPVGNWKANQPYMVSFWAKAASAGAVGATMALAANAPVMTHAWVSNPPLTTTYQRYIASYSRAADTSDSFFFGVGGNFGTNGVSKAVSFDDVQVEEGDVATGYAPRVNEVLPGTINATMLSADAIDGKTITGVDITGSSTITGALFRTAATGARVQMSNINVSRIDWYNSSNSLRHYIASTGDTLTINGPGTAVSGSGLTITNYSQLSLTGLSEVYINALRVDFSTTPIWLRGLSNQTVTEINVNSAGNTRLYNGVNNRMLYQAGTGWYSTEYSASVGCELYGNHIAWSDLKDKSSLKSFGTSKDSIRKKVPSADSALDMMRKLPVYDYDTKHGGAGKGKNGKNILVPKRGIIAQDLFAVAPHLVHDETDDPNTGFGMGVDVYGLLASAIEAIRELDEELTAFKSEMKKEKPK